MGKYKGYDDIKCIWMINRSVDYKICDKNFECQDCDFDKQMISGLKSRGIVQEEIENIFDFAQHTVSFLHPYYHFNKGQLARHFLSNTYYLGLEPYIGKFIDKQSTLKYSTSKDTIEKGEPLLNINNGWGGVTIQSAFRFSFVEKLDMDNIFKKDLHWFAIIEAERVEIMENAINKKNYFEKLHEAKLFLLSLMKTSVESEKTMYDGGILISKWSEILGMSNYKNLLGKLFF